MIEESKNENALGKPTEKLSWKDLLSGGALFVGIIYSIGWLAANTYSTICQVGWIEFDHPTLVKFGIMVLWPFLTSAFTFQLLREHAAPRLKRARLTALVMGILSFTVLTPFDLAWHSSAKFISASILTGVLSAIVGWSCFAILKRDIRSRPTFAVFGASMLLIFYSVIFGIIVLPRAWNASPEAVIIRLDDKNETIEGLLQFNNSSEIVVFGHYVPPIPAVDQGSARYIRVPLSKVRSVTFTSKPPQLFFVDNRA